MNGWRDGLPQPWYAAAHGRGRGRCRCRRGRRRGRGERSGIAKVGIEQPSIARAVPASGLWPVAAWSAAVTAPHHRMARRDVVLGGLACRLLRRRTACTRGKRKPACLPEQLLLSSFGSPRGGRSRMPPLRMRGHCVPHSSALTSRGPAFASIRSTTATYSRLAVLRGAGRSLELLVVEGEVIGRRRSRSAGAPAAPSRPSAERSGARCRRGGRGAAVGVRSPRRRRGVPIRGCRRASLRRGWGSVGDRGHDATVAAARRPARLRQRLGRAADHNRRPMSAPPWASSSPSRSCMPSGTWSPRRPAAMPASALMAALLLVVLWAPLGVWAAGRRCRAGAGSNGRTAREGAVVHVVYFDASSTGRRIRILRSCIRSRCPAPGPCCRWAHCSGSAVDERGRRGRACAGVVVGLFFIAGGRGCGRGRTTRCSASAFVPGGCGAGSPAR